MVQSSTSDDVIGTYISEGLDLDHSECERVLPWFLENVCLVFKTTGRNVKLESIKIICWVAK